MSLIGPRHESSILTADKPEPCARNRHCGRSAPSDYNHGVVVGGRWYCGESCSRRDSDKPEAGRPCKPWCFGPPTIPQSRGKGGCTIECEDAGRPLNPATRPVDHDRWCELKWKQAGCLCADRSKPRHVERCSCEESHLLRDALQDIIDTASETGACACEEVTAIARRALALGGGET